MEILERLSKKSIDTYYNPYRLFEWPDTLPDDVPWMSEDLISAYGTPLWDELDAKTRIELSRWESVNFYSLNVHGIRELIIEVTRRIHTPGFEVPSEFFHHFLGEENEHMWFFAEFCRRYGGKLYTIPSLPGGAEADPAVESFLVFARILLFEEMVDYYNMRMAEDTSLHETIRQINAIHHQDESRHIAFGRELVAVLYRSLTAKLAPEQLREIEAYLKRYLVYSIKSFYNAFVYRDAGIADAFGFRQRLLADERRRAFELKTIRKPLSFFVKIGAFSDASLPED